MQNKTLEKGALQRRNRVADLGAKNESATIVFQSIAWVTNLNNGDSFYKAMQPGI